MAIVNFTANTANFAYNNSAYGGALWGTFGATVKVNVPQGQGTCWIIWQILNSNIPPSETFNGVLIKSGGQNGFAVPGGSARVATLYGVLFNSLAGFAGAPGSAMDTYTPANSPKNINYTLTKSGFTSDNIRNGTMFIGIAVNTDNGDSGAGLGTFTFGSVDMSFYTGSDNPAPIPSAPAGSFVNPAANNNPGRIASLEQFSSITYNLAQPLPQSFLQFVWQIFGSAGITFASNGTTALTQNKGSGNDPGNPYSGSTGNLLIATTVAPGIYSIRCNVTGITSVPNFYNITNLTVRAAPQYGGLLTEF